MHFDATKTLITCAYLRTLFVLKQTKIKRFVQYFSDKQISQKRTSCNYLGEGKRWRGSLFTKRSKSL